MFCYEEEGGTILYSYLPLRLIYLAGSEDVSSSRLGAGTVNLIRGPFMKIKFRKLPSLRIVGEGTMWGGGEERMSG